MNIETTAQNRLQNDEAILITGYSPNLGICRGMLITDKELFYVDGPAPPTRQREFWVTVVVLLIIFWPAILLVLWKYSRRANSPLIQEAWAMLTAKDLDGLRSNGLCKVLDVNTVRRSSRWVRICTPRGSRFYFRAAGRDGRTRILIRRPQQEMEDIRKAAERLGEAL